MKSNEKWSNDLVCVCERFHQSFWLGADAIHIYILFVNTASIFRLSKSEYFVKEIFNAEKRPKWKSGVILAILRIRIVTHWSCTNKDGWWKRERDLERAREKKRWTLYCVHSTTHLIESLFTSGSQKSKVSKCKIVMSLAICCRCVVNVADLFTITIATTTTFFTIRILIEFQMVLLICFLLPSFGLAVAAVAATVFKKWFVSLLLR